MLSGRALDRRRWPEPLQQPEQGSWRIVIDSVHSHTQRVFEEPAKFCLIGEIRRLSDGSPKQTCRIITSSIKNSAAFHQNTVEMALADINLKCEVNQNNNCD